MRQCQRVPKVISLGKRAEDEEKSFFEQLLQEGARKLLQPAIENEVIDYIQFHKDRRDENGQRLVVRNGHLPERKIISGMGPIKVRQPGYDIVTKGGSPVRFCPPIYAPDTQHRRINSGAVSQGNLDRRF
jgi:hypothetical protein